MSEKDVLTEGELEALMESVSGSPSAQDAAGPHQNCQHFDFTTREQALLAQMPALKNLNEKHCLALAQNIAQLYKVAAQLEVDQVQPGLQRSILNNYMTAGVAGEIFRLYGQQGRNIRS